MHVDPEARPSRTVHSSELSSVTKRIEFCYGHRLLDYDGICKHPHGHNAAERDRGPDRLARQPQHGLRLQRYQAGGQGLDRSRARSQDDPAPRRPAGEPLQELGEPIHLLDSNPTVERIARLIFESARRGCRCLASRCGKRRRRGPPTAPDRLRSRRHARRFLPRPRGLGERADRRAGGTPQSEEPCGGWWATAPRAGCSAGAGSPRGDPGRGHCSASRSTRRSRLTPASIRVEVVRLRRHSWWSRVSAHQQAAAPSGTDPRRARHPRPLRCRHRW